MNDNKIEDTSWSLIWQDSDGGYILLRTDDSELRIRRKYGVYGSERDITFPIEVLPLMLHALSNKLDIKNLFYRDKKGQIRKLLES